MREINKFVRAEYLQYDAREILQLSPAALLGVTTETSDALKKLDILTIFDLANSIFFANANLLLEAHDNPSHIFSKHGAAPRDIVDPLAQRVPITPPKTLPHPQKPNQTRLVRCCDAKRNVCKSLT